MRRYAHLALAFVAACSGAFTADTAAADKMGSQPRTPATSVRGEGPMPALAGATLWLNSPPLTPRRLRGKVVLVDFWTYTCINWLRTLPYVRAWAEKYKDQGLVVIGVHTPEFEFEKNSTTCAGPRRTCASTIRSPSTTTMRSGMPSAISIGRRSTSSMRRAAIRHHQFGEGDYERSERIIQQLLSEAGHKDIGAGAASRSRRGRRSRGRLGQPEVAGDLRRLRPRRNFASPGGLASGQGARLRSARAAQLNHWALAGDWTVAEAGDGSRTRRTAESPFASTRAICIS